MNDLVITKYIQEKDSYKIDNYVKNGGYKASVRALTTMTSDQIIDEVKKSNLRGRGGAGFPAGMKWSFMPKDNKKTKYLVCNADEGEPGTFKDRLIITKNPHAMIEGMIIASFAIGANVAYLYIRGEFFREARMLEFALNEARAKGHLGKNLYGTQHSFDIYIYRGAGAYICGEETALLNSLEGKRGEPRLKPPFPAQVGAFGMPSCVNNVETFASVPYIINEGAAKFAAMGTERSGGTRLYGVSGHITRPGIYELPLTITIRELIEHCGGVRGGKKLKAVIPGGASAPMLSADDIDVKLEFDALMKAGSMAGSGGVIVIDETVCIVEMACILLKFYEHESCGQCTQCREGSHWLAQLFQRIESGGGTMADLDTIAAICGNMAGQTICAFADAVTGPALSAVRKFRSEFEQHIIQKGCPFHKNGHPHSHSASSDRGVAHV